MSAALRDRLSKLEGRKEALEHAIVMADRSLVDMRRSLEALSIAKDVFIKASEVCLERFNGAVTTVSSEALRDVFGEGWTMRMEMSSRGKTNLTQEASLLVVGPTGHATEPMGGNGGGLGDVASWALRLSMLSIARPEPRKILVLDEPFIDLSSDLRHLGGDMLKRVAKGLGFQVIMTSNEREYVNLADLVVEPDAWGM